jgi:hypothetical protein
MLLVKPFPVQQYDKKPRYDEDFRSTLRAGVHRIYLPAPFNAKQRLHWKTEPSP